MKLAYVLSALMGADVVSTVIGLNRGCVEANPLADILGMPTLYTMKGVLIICLLLTAWLFESAPEWMRLLDIHPWVMVCYPRSCGDFKSTFRLWRVK